MPAQNEKTDTPKHDDFPLAPLGISALLCLAVVALDFSAPHEMVSDAAYIPLIFCSLWFTQPRAAFIFAFIATALGTGVFFSKHSGNDEPWVLHANHLIILVATWIVAGLIYLLQYSKEKLLRYTKDLERSNQELDDFAYIASHDLKEPLRGLFNNAKFLEQDFHEKLDETGLGRLQRMGYLSQRMESLINDLLYFSRLGRQELAVQPTDLNEVVRDIAAMMETTFKERNIKLLVPRPLPTILCDKTRVTELFRNLIGNAAKYNDKAEKTVEVGYLDICRTANGVERQVFFVRDNGIGIEEEFYDEILRIFKRLNEEEDDKKGTGVGLTFVRKIVERHNGRIWLDSKPGKGTTFYFTLNQGELNHAAAA
jgi:light-regulated signal transduction histidine kinase (bacteriophytochrome)